MSSRRTGTDYISYGLWLLACWGATHRQTDVFSLFFLPTVQIYLVDYRVCTFQVSSSLADRLQVFFFEYLCAAFCPVCDVSKVVLDYIVSLYFLLVSLHPS